MVLSKNYSKFSKSARIIPSLREKMGSKVLTLFAIDKNLKKAFKILKELKDERERVSKNDN